MLLESTFTIFYFSIVGPSVAFISFCSSASLLLRSAYLSLALSGPNKEQNQHAGSLGIKLLSGVMANWDAPNKGSREDKMMGSAWN